MIREKDTRLEAKEKQLQILSSGSKLGSTTSKPTSKENQLVFNGFAGILKDAELATLRSIKKTKTGDSSFVLTCLRSVYSDNLEVLRNRSVKGLSKTKPRLSSHKFDTMKSMFGERLSNLDLSKTECDDRKKLFDRHLNYAIQIVKKTLNKTAVTSVCEHDN